MTAASQIASRAQALLAGRDSATLIADFLATDSLIANADPVDRSALVTTRGWIMQAIEDRGDDGLLAVALGNCPTCWADMRDGDTCPDGCDR